jgi:vitamin B12 transporter
MHQISPTERLHLSFAGRVDSYETAGTFATVRATAAYEIFETETKIRGSVGTGAKAPTPFQLYCDYEPGVDDCGNPDLSAEESVGIDLGIDQMLFDGAVSVSATGFYNRFDDMIAWLDTDGWQNPADPGRYANIASAETAGLELEGTWHAIPGKLDLGVAYTYLYSRDLDTDRELLLRAPHSGSLTVTYTGIDKLRLGATVRAVGERVDHYVGDTAVRLDPFVTVDLDASYDITENVTLTGRVVNLFDVEYEEVEGYNTSGLAAYGGLKVRW